MKGNISLAISEFKKSLLLDPENVIALEKMAYLTTAMGDHETSLQYYKKASELKPDDDDIMLGLANSYEINENIEEALKVLEKLKQEKRKVEKLDFYLSRLYFKTKKIEDAEKSIKLAKKEYPNDEEIKELEQEIKDSKKKEKKSKKNE
jgi:Flp pilus assembly protein TadD